MKEKERRKGILDFLWQKIGTYKYVLLVIVAGALLLMLPHSDQSQKTVDGGTGEGADTAFDLDELERGLEQALSRIEGAGEVTVVLTLKSGTRKVLAEDSRADGAESSRETVVVSQGSSMEDGLLLQEVYPQFRGALIVCPGGNIASVRLSVLEAVSALTGLSSDCISICVGNG